MGKESKGIGWMYLGNGEGNAVYGVYGESGV